MSRSVFTLVLASLLALACDPAPTAPAPTGLIPSLDKPDGPNHAHSRTPFAQTVMNSCPMIPEPVAVEGWLIYNSHFKEFDGGNRNRLMTNIQGSGIGAISGVKYQFHQLTTIYGTFTRAAGRLEADHYTRMHLISQTTLDNFFMTVRMKQVCTSEGCTMTVVSMETDCRG